MKYNPKNTLYKVVCITKDGKVYDITKGLTALNWDDQEGELARKAILDVYNVEVEKNKWLTSIFKLTDKVIIYADIDGQGPKEVLRSAIWEWDYLSSSTKILTLLLYEDSFYLTRSEGNFFKGKGKQTKDLVEEIGKQAGIKIDYQFSSISHQQVKYQKRKYSDMIKDLLEEVKKETGQKYMMLVENATLTIKERGGSSNYVLDVSNTIRTRNKLSKMDMVTKVKVTSSSSKADQEPKIIEEKEKNTAEYGEIQAVVSQAKKDDKGSAGNEADNLLKEKSEPEELVEVQAIDYPFLRKGETVKLKAGNLIDTFYILSASHDAKSQTMDLTLERKK